MVCWRPRRAPYLSLLAPIALAALLATGCGNNPTAAPPAGQGAGGSTTGGSGTGGAGSSTAAAPGSDACALLPPAQARAVLGKPIQNTKNEIVGMYASCYYSGATDSAGVHFVQVQVAQTPYTKASFDTLVRNEVAAGAKAPQPVAGFGDAAYDVSPGYLQVLSGTTFFQVSVAGTANDPAGCRDLTRVVLSRLK